MLRKSLIALMAAFIATPALAHEQIIEHAHADNGLIVYAAPALLIALAIAVLALSVMLTHPPRAAKNKNRKS